MEKRWVGRAQYANNISVGKAWHWSAFVVGIGVVVGGISMAVTATVYKDSLRTRIHTIAESLDSGRVADGRYAPTESGTGGLVYLKNKLARIKDANADSRFVYLMARDSNDRVYFVADSEIAGTSGYSPRGQAYPEASSQLKAIFDNGQVLVEGPSRDSYGNWLSALAPIVDDQSYRITTVVGMDVPATTYGLLLGLAGGIPLLLALFAAAIVFVRLQSRRHREQHVQFRAEMLSIASHELRTPLTGLRWSEESLLGQKMTSASQRHMVEIMYDITRRLQESIEDILQLASLESGKAQRLFRKSADIRAIISDIIDTQRLAAERNKITIKFSDSWPKELPIECDLQRMKRVFNNVISNAVKYSKPDSQITIGYSWSNSDGHIISVIDHGIGIPKDEQAKVWQGFYRAGNAAEHSVNGTGMGLYLAKAIIEQHGGCMRLESEQNKGTTVFIELPS